MLLEAYVVRCAVVEETVTANLNLLCGQSATAPLHLTHVKLDLSRLPQLHILLSLSLSCYSAAISSRSQV